MLRSGLRAFFRARRETFRGLLRNSGCTGRRQSDSSSLPPPEPDPRRPAALPHPPYSSGVSGSVSGSAGRLHHLARVHRVIAGLELARHPALQRGKGVLGRRRPRASPRVAEAAHLPPPRGRGARRSGGPAPPVKRPRRFREKTPVSSMESLVLCPRRAARVRSAGARTRPGRPGRSSTRSARRSRSPPRLCRSRRGCSSGSRCALLLSSPYRRVAPTPVGNETNATGGRSE